MEGRLTTVAATSAWNCSKGSLAVMPPSTWDWSVGGGGKNRRKDRAALRMRVPSPKRSEGEMAEQGTSARLRHLDGPELDAAVLLHGFKHLEGLEAGRIEARLDQVLLLVEGGEPANGAARVLPPVRREEPCEGGHEIDALRPPHAARLKQQGFVRQPLKGPPEITVCGA